MEDTLGMQEDWGNSSNNDSDDDSSGSNVHVVAAESSDDESNQLFNLHNVAEKGDVESCLSILESYIKDEAFEIRLAEYVKDMDEEQKAAAIIKTVAAYRAKLIDRRDEENCTPLHVAILARQLETAKVLIEQGANMNIRCNNAPLIHLLLGVACIGEHIQFVESMLNYILGKDSLPENAFYLKDELGRTVLHLVAEFNLPSCLKILLDKFKPEKTDLLITDDTTETALHRACRVKSLEVVKMLLSYGEDTLRNKSDSKGLIPLHVCAENDFVDGFKLLENDASKALKDERGRTALDIAKLFGSACIVKEIYGETINVPRESNTLILSHDVCSKHYTCSPKWTTRRGIYDTPPENVNRLKVLLDQDLGILRSSRFKSKLIWETPTRANIADILRVHDHEYVSKIQSYCAELDEESDLGQLDGDTTISKLSFEAALVAAGSVCDAIDNVCAGTYKNAFCAVRPPGHHAGPRGVVTSKNDPNGSYGFCLLSNAAIGAAYARHVYRHQGIKKVAIIDFDVHHGNGTEACVKNLIPNNVKKQFETPFAEITVSSTSYKPWLNENDWENVFFASIHGYGKRMPGMNPDPHVPPYGMFYPSDGANFGFGEYEKSHEGEPVIVDVGQNSTSRDEWRSSWRCNVLPQLAEFNPDIILISAGFDAHKLDDINGGYISAVEHDYYWLTQELVKIANKCSKGRIVSILEGGYKIQGRIVSPFARSVYNHVAALVETSSELNHDREDMKWEEEFEEKLRKEIEENKRAAEAASEDEPSSKRSRRSASKPVDYVALNAELSKKLSEENNTEDE